MLIKHWPEYTDLTFTTVNGNSVTFSRHVHPLLSSIKSTMSADEGEEEMRFEKSFCLKIVLPIVFGIQYFYLSFFFFFHSLKKEAGGLRSLFFAC